MKTVKTIIAVLFSVVSLASCTKEKIEQPGIEIINIKGGDFLNANIEAYGNWLYYRYNNSNVRNIRIILSKPAIENLKVTYTINTANTSEAIYFYIPKGTSIINEPVMNNGTYDDLQFISITKQ